MTLIALAELVEDLDLYPRSQVSATNVANIVAALQAGHEVPPPVVDRKSKRIVDGVHRVRGFRRVLGPEGSIDVELRTFKTDVELFAAAVELNVGHGLPLQEIEKRRVVLRLQEMGADQDTVAAVLHCTPERVSKLVFHSATTTIEGGKVKVEPLKAPLFHMTGQNLTADQVRAARTAPGTSYKLVVRQLQEALQYGLIDMSDEKLMESLVALNTSLSEFLAGVDMLV